MNIFGETKLELLKSIARLISAINREIDWYLISLDKRNPKLKTVAEKMFCEAQSERRQLAKEEYERFR